MIDNLIKSILGQIDLLIERRAPEELMKTLPNGQWELLRKSTKTPESPHTQANAMTSRLFHHANAVHEALQPHIDKHMTQFRSAPMKPNDYNTGMSRESSLLPLHEQSVDVPVHPALQVWGDQVEEKTGSRPDLNTIKGTRGALKQHLLNLPQGEIDLGHLNKLREGSKKIPQHVNAWQMGDPNEPVDLNAPVQDDAAIIAGFNGNMENTYANRILSTQDMAEIINHHVGKAKSLKEVHDKNGGIGAVEALGRTMGANTNPLKYSSLKLHPQVHADLSNLMNPGSHTKSIETPEHEAHVVARTRAHMDARQAHPNASWEEHDNMANESVPPFEGITHRRDLPDSTYKLPAYDRKDPHQQAVDNTFEQMMDVDNANNGDDQQIAMARKAHENAVIKRAIHHFKRHHKL